MTKVYIPDIGSIIECAEDWTFVLYNEHRNYAMAEAVGQRASTQNRWASDSRYGQPYGTVTLPKGTKLRIDRLYVRKGLAEYSSVTFVIQETDDSRFYSVGPKGGKKLKRTRFWSKLADVNEGNWNLVSDPSAAPAEEES